MEAEEVGDEHYVRHVDAVLFPFLKAELEEVREPEAGSRPRFDDELQGEEGIRMWEEATTVAQAVADTVSNGPGTIQANPAITQLSSGTFPQGLTKRSSGPGRGAAMPSRTPEQEFRILDNIRRADAFTGALVALDIAVEHEEDRCYAHWLTTFVREHLEEEHDRAQDTHHAYLRELGLED